MKRYNKRQSLEGKFYQNSSKLLSEKPEDISVVDLGGSLFNSRIAYYDIPQQFT